MSVDEEPTSALGQAAALQAVARIVTAASRGAHLQTLRRSLAREARALMRADAAIVVGLDGPDGAVRVLAAEPSLGDDAQDDDGRPLSEVPAIEELVVARRGFARASGAAAHAQAAALGVEPAEELLAVALRSGESLEHALVLLAPDAEAFADDHIEIAAGFAAVAGAVLGQTNTATEHATHAARQSALARAAKALTASLDLEAVLSSISREAQRILDADVVTVYRDVGGGDGLVLEAGHNLGDAVLGHRMAPRPGAFGPRHARRPADVDERLPALHRPPEVTRRSPRCAARWRSRCAGTASCTACSVGSGARARDSSSATT